MIREAAKPPTPGSTAENRIFRTKISLLPEPNLRLYILPCVERIPDYFRRRTTMAFGPAISLTEGDVAPSFTAVTSGGGKVALKDFKGKYVILYFYPKDNTPGCNKEACDFRDLHKKIERKNAVVLGVSVDSVKSHDRFIEKFDLPFVLLSDEDRKIVNAYGVWGRKKFMGREFDGTHRATFLIDPKGRIKRIWAKVKVESHAEEVFAALNS